MHLEAAESPLAAACPPLEATESSLTAADLPSEAAEYREGAADCEGEAVTSAGAHEGGTVVSEEESGGFEVEGVSSGGDGVEALSAVEGKEGVWRPKEGFMESESLGVGVQEQCVGAIVIVKFEGAEGLPASEGFGSPDSEPNRALVDLDFSVGMSKVEESSDLASRLESDKTHGNAHVEETIDGENVKSTLSKRAQGDQRGLEFFAVIAALLVLVSSALVAILTGSFRKSKSSK